MKQKVIGFLGFDNFVALDIAGPAEAFASCILKPEVKAESLYKVLVIGLDKKPIRSESGIEFVPHHTIKTCPSLDTLIIPGGSGLRDEFQNNEITGWIRANSKGIRRIASICTGIYGLASTGLLNGRNVTTHWRYSKEVASRYPKLKMNSDAIFIKDGSFYTSAGATAGIDLALALIEEDHGSEMALSVARELVVFCKRPGGQEQYSEPLQFQSQSTNEFTNLTAWISSHLHLRLSVEDLAKKVCLCPRHFARKFKAQLGVTPAAFVENLRLKEACRRLTTSPKAIQGVATSLGFQSDDAFRRAFERRFGVAPTHYRNRFSTTLK